NDQLTTHQQYLDYFDILKRIADSSWIANDLDTVSVQTLLEIKDYGASAISACARGLLVKGGFLDYIETITLPQLASSEEYSYSNKIGNNSAQNKDFLKLFPNPAGEYVIVYYDITSNSQLITLRIIDNQGIVIRTFLFDSSKNQVVVDLENIPNGIYFFTLYIDGIQIESQKLIRLRN
nr:T9SS type A sorting domain-containing protein [Bacteroidales bacterium]